MMKIFDSASGRLRRAATACTFAVAALFASMPMAQAVEVVSDVVYKPAAGLNAYAQERAKLDLYLPDGADGFATLVWFYGGALTNGDRGDPTHTGIARSLAERGVAVAVVDYRLSPTVSFPAYVEDAAAGVAWVLGHIDEHGGDAGRVFVSGHSAGAYLVSMIGLDAGYLAAHGVSPRDLAGLIPISGQMVTHSTVRNERSDSGSGMIADAAAPLFHVSADAPPLLAIAGSDDLPARPEENRLFVAALEAAGHADVAYLEFEGRNHGTIVTQIPQAGDPVAAAMVEFIERHSN